MGKERWELVGGPRDGDTVQLMGEAVMCVLLRSGAFLPFRVRAPGWLARRAVGGYQPRDPVDRQRRLLRWEPSLF
jgi:hypothetical protein